MFRLQSPDLIAENDQPFIFGHAARVPTPMAHTLRLTQNRIGSIPCSLLSRPIAPAGRSFCLHCDFQQESDFLEKMARYRGAGIPGH